MSEELERLKEGAEGDQVRVPRVSRLRDSIALECYNRAMSARGVTNPLAAA